MNKFKLWGLSLMLSVLLVGCGTTNSVETANSTTEETATAVVKDDSHKEKQKAQKAIAKQKEEQKKEQEKQEQEKQKQAKLEQEKQGKAKKEQAKKQQATDEKVSKQLSALQKELTTLTFEGTQTIEVNDNQPLFTSKDLSLADGSWEHYGDLDQLNRVTAAQAMLNQDLMPTEKRGDISNVTPTGWKNKKLAKGYLFNRSHLIGFALSGENDNWKNLMTGTAQLNNPEMLRHEMDLKYYLEQSPDHFVRYSVTPIFKGDELLARGVHLMAQSIKDDGIHFNVYIFNVQEGVDLNYADGSSVTSEEVAAKKEQEHLEAKKAEEARLAKEAAQAE